MRKAVIVALGLLGIVVGIGLLRLFGGSTTQDESRQLGADTKGASREARDQEKGPLLAQPRDRHPSGPRPGESSAEGSAASVRGMGAEVRSTGEALRPRVREGVGGHLGEESEFEVGSPSEAKDQKVAQLKPDPNVQRQALEVSSEISAQGEVPPEVVFEGGKDRRFFTETQVELTDVGRISGEAGTVALWVKPDWQADDQNDAVFVQLGERGVRVTKNVNFLRFEFIDDQGIERGAGAPLDDWKPGEWHQVTGVWSQGQLRLYVNGKLVSQAAHEFAPNFGEEPKVYIGSKLPSGVPAAAEMADIRILNRVLQPDEIGELAQTANRPE